MAVWRCGQILLALDALGRHKPWDRRRRFRIGDLKKVPVYDPAER